MAKRIGAERRTIADVGDGIEALAAHPGARDVDAVFRDQFVVARQVDGGHGVFRSVAASAARGRENAERTCQQMTRTADTAFAQKLTDVAAGNRLAAQAHLRVVVDFKSHLRPSSRRI